MGESCSVLVLWILRGCDDLSRADLFFDSGVGIGASGCFRDRRGLAGDVFTVGSGGQLLAVDSAGTGLPGNPASRMIFGQRGSQQRSSEIQ